MAKLIKASDCKCCKCGKQAVAFWPCIDPDIPQHPYCRECLDAEKLKAMIATFGDDGKDMFDAWNAKNAKTKTRTKNMKRKK